MCVCVLMCVQSWLLASHVGHALAMWVASINPIKGSTWDVANLKYVDFCFSILLMAPWDQVRKRDAVFEYPACMVKCVWAPARTSGATGTLACGAMVACSAMRQVQAYVFAMVSAIQPFNHSLRLCHDCRADAPPNPRPRAKPSGLLCGSDVQHRGAHHPAISALHSAPCGVRHSHPAVPHAAGESVSRMEARQGA